MTDLLIFSLSDAVIPLQELLELTGTEAITTLGNPDVPAGYEVRWPDLTISLRLLSGPEAARHLADVWAFAQGILADRDDNKARKNLRRVGLARQVWQVSIDPEPDAANRARDLVLGVLAYYEQSFLYGDGAIYNEFGKRFLGPEEARTKLFVDNVPQDSPEAAQRKARTLARLQREKIPFIDHLPVIADSAQVTLRTPQQIAQRLVCLLLIADVAEGKTLAEYAAQLEAFNLREEATPDELAFAHDPTPIKQDVIKFSQRVEAAWVLGWALGVVETLGRPDDFCQPEALQRWRHPAGLADLMREARPRAATDVLDMYDLHYRYHWAVNDAELYGTRVPGHLIPAVVYERHYALHWLTSTLEWDKVTTDT
jgi:hypothetical protein